MSYLCVGDGTPCLEVVYIVRRVVWWEGRGGCADDGANLSCGHAGGGYVVML